jgi:hypothetical protein
MKKLYIKIKLPIEVDDIHDKNEVQEATLAMLEDIVNSGDISAFADNPEEPGADEYEDIDSDE